MTDAKPVLASDIDGTLFRRQTLEVFVHALIDHGVFPSSYRRTFDRLTRRLLDRRIDFEEYTQGILDLSMRGIVGKSVRDVRRVCAIVARRHHRYVYAFTDALLAQLAPTHQRIAITGACEPVMARLAPLWGFDRWYGTVLEVRDGRYTGEVVSSPFEDKGRTLREHLASRPGSVNGSVAIGNTASDISMLELATHPIAFNPDYALFYEARRRRWVVVREKTDVISIGLGGEELVYRISDAATAVADACALLRMQHAVRVLDNPT